MILQQPKHVILPIQTIALSHIEISHPKTKSEVVLLHGDVIRESPGFPFAHPLLISRSHVKDFRKK
jgi:hypothetical protein